MERVEVEVCPYCSNEISMRWNVERDGYQINCPFCGKKIMLCNACRHSDDNPEQKCDWSEEYNCFRKPKAVAFLTVLKQKLEKYYKDGIKDWDEILSLFKKEYATKTFKTNHDQLKKMGLADEMLFYIPKRTISMLVTNEKEVCVMYVDSDAKVKVKEF